jgi:hypothetical protein
VVPPGIKRALPQFNPENFLPPEGTWDAGVPQEYRHLKMDYRGMPTPFAYDSHGYTRAVESKLCGMCGGNLDYWIFFICRLQEVDRQFFKGPGHHESCAKYAVTTLPTSPPEGIYLYRCRGYTIMRDPESKEKMACQAFTRKGLERIS